MTVAALGCATRSELSLDQAVRGGCWPEEGYRNAAIAYQARGEDWRRVWLRLAEQPWPTDEAWCGIASLSVIGDPRVVPALSRALDMSQRVPRWAGSLVGAAYDLASFPRPVPGESLLPLLEAIEGYLSEPPLNEEAYLVLGHIDHPRVRTYLESEFRQQTGDRQVLSVVAMAIQADPMAVQFARLLVLDSASTTPHRLRQVALALLIADVSSVSEGGQLLERIPEDVRPATGRRAVQVVCERSLRQPARAGQTVAHRAALEAELDRLGISWRAVPVRTAAACA